MRNRISAVLGQEWIYIAASAVVVAAAFFLRIYRIGQDELWLDEAGSFYLVTFSKWPQAFFLDNTPPLYYSFLSGWISLFGQTESAIRLLSALFGTLFVAAIIWAGRQIVDGRAGLWSGVVSAVAPIQIYYSQEARSYGLLTLLLTLAYATLWRALETRKWLWWAGFSLFVLLALYTHYFAILGLAPTALLLWLWPGPEHARERWRGYAVSVAISLLLFLPWIVAAYQGTRSAVSKIDWILYMWRQTGPWLAIPKSLEVFTLGSQAGFTSALNVKRFGELSFPGWLRVVGLGMAALLGILAAVPWGEKELAMPWLGRRKAWLWSLLFFPLLALVLISFYKPVYVVGRYDIVAFPAYALLLGFALAKVRRIGKLGPLLAGAAAVALFVPIGTKLLAYYSVPPQLDTRATAVALHEVVRNRDVLVLSRPRAKTTIYYLTRLGYRWEEGHCSDPAGYAFSCWMFPSDRQSRPALREQVQQYLRAMGPPDGVVWVVFEGEVLPDGRLKVGSPESLLVSELEKANLHPVPIDYDNAIVQFR